METLAISEIPFTSGDHLCVHCKSCINNIPRIGRRMGFIPKEVQMSISSVPENEQEANMPHWPTFDEFLNSASENCHLCALFLLQLCPRDRLRISNWERDGAAKAFPAITRITIIHSTYEETGLYEIWLRYPMPSDVLLSRRQKRNEMKVHLRHATG
jgi:hypothetical protein